ncbi:MAG TPA: hypothetical protein VMD99_12930 [Terriglobales bacterium]|nr:hypothetical protein [Terriglobales bacterium]
MRATRRKPEPPQFLSGWKDIANYLGKGVRTVQRYERQMSLPVRRPAGRPSGSVVATKAELDAWVSASPIREAFHLPSPSCNYAASADAIRTGIEEMRKLRDQMVALRAEWRTSVSLLRQSVRSLRADLKQDYFRQPNPDLAIVGLDSSAASLADLLVPQIKRKAS